jgi:hypothetical protein
MFFNSTRPWRKASAFARRRMFPRKRPIELRLEHLEDRTSLNAPPLLVTNLNVSGNGSLRAAVQTDANPGSTIDFAKGLHGTILVTSGDLDITASTTINGPGAYQIAVSGNNASRIFNVSGSSTVATISGLTITDGQANDRGAAS